MDYFTLTLEGSQLKSCYLVYVIVVSHKSKGLYFYIGQTGDRAHITARPSFRRLMGHLINQPSSTENQVYQHIAKKLGYMWEQKNEKIKETKQKMEAFFTKSTITMYSFPLEAFDYEASKEEHTHKRQYAEAVEKLVIKEMSNIYKKDRILNKQSGVSKQQISQDKAEKTATEIVQVIREQYEANGVSH